jgi:flagellar hook-basal body complex protein FliE
MASEIDFMIRGIGGVGGVERPEATRGIEKAAKSGEGSFVGELGKALGQMDKMQVDADQQAKMVAEGGGNLHEMSLALEKADISMRLAMKVRTKLVDAYNEIMRMSI